MKKSEADEKSQESSSKSMHKCSCGTEIPFEIFRLLRQDISAMALCPNCGYFLRWNEKEERIVVTTN